MPTASRTLRNLVQQGSDFLKRQAWNESITPLLEAHRLQANNPAVCFFLALAYYALGDLVKAKTYIKQGLDLNPKNTLGQNLLALLAFRDNDLTTAITLIDQYGMVENHEIQAFFLFEVERSLGELE